MKTVPALPTLLFTLGIIALPATSHALTLISGYNLPLGVADPDTTFSPYPGLAPNVPSAADFLAAQSGSFAITTPEYTGIFLPASALAPGAQYLTTDGQTFGPPRSALFARSFFWPIAETVTLSLSGLVDNNLNGIFLNTGMVPGTFQTWNFNPVTTVTQQVSVNAGTNWLYFNLYEGGGAAGLAYKVDITSASSSAPEPGTLALLALGLLGSAIARRKSVGKV